MATTMAPARRVSLAEFDAIFESVKNWGRWGADDELGTLNLITPEQVRAAAALVRTGRRVSLAIPINTVAGPDNPSPALHYIDAGPRHRHRLERRALRPRLPRAWPSTATATPTSTRSTTSPTRASLQRPARAGGRDHQGLGRRLGMDNVAKAWSAEACLFDMPRFRGVKWLEPGEAVTRAELEACEQAQGVRIGEGDIFVYRTGHHRRRAGTGSLGQRTKRARARPACTWTRSPGCTSAASPRSSPTATARRCPSCVDGHHLPDPPAAGRRHGHAHRPTACSSRTWRRRARKRAVTSSWSWACRCAFRVVPARPGTRLRSSDLDGGHRRVDRSPDRAHAGGGVLGMALDAAADRRQGWNLGPFGRHRGSDGAPSRPITGRLAT